MTGGENKGLRGDFRRPPHSAKHAVAHGVLPAERPMEHIVTSSLLSWNTSPDGGRHLRQI